MEKHRIAVVGSGPAGLYAADSLVRQDAFDIEVDIIDRIPAPYGLVRYGVAPDHPRIKSVVRSLQRILEHPKVRFLGNINVGTDIEPQLLQDSYAAVIYATGASQDRQLDIEGEDLAGSHSATRFVSWYSGHPDHNDAFDLSARSVAVVGAGNVALDVARILAKTAEELHPTDMPHDVLERLRASHVQDIHIVCRRGPEHAKFTTKELRELLHLADADVIVDPADLPAVLDQGYDATTSENLAAFREMAGTDQTKASRRIIFHFWQKPIRMTGTDTVESIELERTELDQSGNLVGTGHLQSLPVQLVLRSVGYRSLPMDWLPFDEVRGIIPNKAGRVTGPDGSPVHGLYVSGWVKRGPSGIIGTNKVDSSETVATLLSDLDAGGGRPSRSAEEFVEELDKRNVKVVYFDGWQNIDEEEILRGQHAGKDRTKISDWDTLRNVADSAQVLTGERGQQT